MRKHILLENAFVYDEPSNTLNPEGCSFHSSRGYWVTGSGSGMMLEDDNVKVQSKKCDIETGEDQKGE